MMTHNVDYLGTYLGRYLPSPHPPRHRISEFSGFLALSQATISYICVPSTSSVHTYYHLSYTYQSVTSSNAEEYPRSSRNRPIKLHITPRRSTPLFNILSSPAPSSLLLSTPQPLPALHHPPIHYPLSHSRPSLSNNLT